MCLEKGFELKVDGRFRYGYKVFNKNEDGSLESLYNNRCEINDILRGNSQPIFSNGKSYPGGVHIFPRLRDARKYVVEDDVLVRVRYRWVIATGIQSYRKHWNSKEVHLKTVVALEAELLEIVE